MQPATEPAVPPPSSASPRTPEATGTERGSLVASIVDLDAELAAGEITPQHHARLRERYVRRLAQTLQPTSGDGGTAVAGISDRSGTDTADGASPTGERARQKTRFGARIHRRWVLVAGVACLLAGAATLTVSLASGSTTQRLPGESASGSLKLSTSQQISRALQQAQVLEVEGDYSQALGVYDQILRSHPHQPEALAYSGWIVQLAGEADHSDARLEDEAFVDEQDAVAASPTYPDARYFLGAVLYEDFHDPSAALTQFQAFMADGPSAAFLEAASPVVAEAYEAAGQAVPAAVKSDIHN